MTAPAREPARYEGAAAVAALQVLAYVLNASTDNRADHLLTDDQRVIRATGAYLTRLTRRLIRQRDDLVLVPAPPIPSDHHIERLFALHDLVLLADARENEAK